MKYKEITYEVFRCENVKTIQDGYNLKIGSSLLTTDTRSFHINRHTYPYIIYNQYREDIISEVVIEICKDGQPDNNDVQYIVANFMDNIIKEKELAFSDEYGGYKGILDALNKLPDAIKKLSKEEILKYLLCNTREV